MGLCIAKWAQLQRSHLSMVMLDAHQGNRVDLYLSVGIMNSLILSASSPAPLVVSLVKKWPLPTGWECWGGQDWQDATGAVLDRQAWADLCMRPPHGSSWRRPGAAGHVETQVNARPHFRPWLPVAHSILTVTLGLHWEFHINSMRWRHDTSHDRKLGQHLTDFGQGGWAAFT